MLLEKSKTMFLHNQIRNHSCFVTRVEIAVHNNNNNNVFSTLICMCVIENVMCQHTYTHKLTVILHLHNHTHATNLTLLEL